MAAAPTSATSAPRAGRSFWGMVALVAGKDLRVELRSREILYTMTFFGALLVVVFTFAFSRDVRAISSVVPGMLWVSLAFAGTVGLGRAFDRERENDTMRALLLSPAPRLAVFLGKAISVAVLVAAVAMVVTPLLAFLLDAPLFVEPVPLICVLALGVLGFAIVGTTFAAMLMRSRARDVLLPVVLYPVLVPMFIAGTKATQALLLSHPNMQAAWYWVEFLGVYDAVFLTVSVWTFESLVIE